MKTILLSYYAYQPVHSARGRPRKYPTLWNMARLSVLSGFTRLCQYACLEVGHINMSDALIRRSYTLLQRRLRRAVRRKFNLALDAVSFEVMRQPQGDIVLVILP